MERRAVLRGLGVTAGLAVGGAGAYTLSQVLGSDDEADPGSGSAASASPNILMIVIDDANDYVGHLGGYPGRIETPNIDALASQGEAFRYAYTPVPSCGPARASILASRSPGETGVATEVRITGPGKIYDELAADPDHLVRVFRRNGYETLGAGKVDHKPVPEIWDDFGPAVEDLIASGKASESATGIAYGILPDDEVHPDVAVADWTIDALGAEHERPFLLVPGFYLPHVPWRVPSSILDLYPLDDIVLPTLIEDDYDDEVALARSMAGVDGFDLDQDPRLWAENIQYFLAAYTHTDQQVGRVLDALASSRFADDTIVMLWSDNGFGLGEKMHFGKSALWERSTRVPLVIKGLPGGEFGAPKVVERPVSLLDIAPTLTHLSGIPTPDTYDGLSLHVDDGRPAQMWYQTSMATRIDTIREIEWRDENDELVGISRYDLATDPGETRNLLSPAEQQELIAERG